MKLGGAPLARLTECVRGVDTPERRDAYRRGDFPRADRVKNLDMRYRWDVFYAAGGFAMFDGMDMPADIEDAHIDTALRRAVPSLGE